MQIAKLNAADPAEFKIEKGVPFLGEGRYPFKDMNVGDSFQVPQHLLGSIRTSSWQYGRNHNKRFSVRRSADGYRCWRIA